MTGILTGPRSRSWAVGGRDAGAVYEFMHDLAGRFANRVQLTTDEHRLYFSAVEDAFGSEIDYAMLVKLYGKGEQGPEAIQPRRMQGRS